MTQLHLPLDAVTGAPPDVCRPPAPMPLQGLSRKTRGLAALGPPVGLLGFFPEGA